MRRHHLVLSAFAAALAVVACGSDSSSSSSSGVAVQTTTTTTTATFTCQTGSATAHGSTALLPAVAKAATNYQTKCPGSTVTASGGGSSEGISKAVDGSFDIGDSDVPSSNAKGVDTSQLKDHQVAVVIFAVIVNPATKVTNLTTQQVVDIFSGKVTNWKDVGGADLAVTLYFRKAGSGTRLSFQKDVMKTATESSSPAGQLDATQTVLTAVGKPGIGGVSYVALGSVDSTVTAVSIDGVTPGAAALASGNYAFFAHEHMYTKGDGSAIAQSFIQYMLSDEFQNGDLKTLGFLPVATTKALAAVDQ
jgi:phosphate transport system substrate-binding protein